MDQSMAADSNVKLFEPTAVPRVKESEFSHTFPIHVKETSSPLSAESPVQDYSGLQNLVTLLLFVNTLRLVIENILKYGFLVTFGKISINEMDIIFAIALYALVPLTVLIALSIENLAIPSAIPNQKVTNKKTDETITPGSKYSFFAENSKTLHLLNVFSNLIITNYCGYTFMGHPLLIFFNCVVSAILALKLISYGLVNRDLRNAFLANKHIKNYGKDVIYPKNITMSNLVYFYMAPTLCYQPSYPRTPRFRKSFFLKRIAELFICIFMMYFITEQYIRPTLKNSLGPFNELNWAALLERLLKLSIPSIFFWFFFFYVIFHSYLNLAAEVLSFGDRQFYKPWWNARTISEYWRLWNLPVYQWFKRHVYVPILTSKKNYPKWLAGVVAFFISTKNYYVSYLSGAVGHEILVGIPTHLVKGWAFWGMMMQVPLIYTTEYIYKLEQNLTRQKRICERQALEKDGGVALAPVDEKAENEIIKRISGRVGNYVFWISFCVLGQPLGVLLYYRSYLLSSLNK